MKTLITALLLTMGTIVSVNADCGYIMIDNDDPQLDVFIAFSEHIGQGACIGSCGECWDITVF